MSEDWDDDDWWDDPEPIIETVIKKIQISNVQACDIQVFEKAFYKLGGKVEVEIKTSG
jgi:hypothetical protein